MLVYKGIVSVNKPWESDFQCPDDQEGSAPTHASLLPTATLSHAQTNEQDYVREEEEGQKDTVTPTLAADSSAENVTPLGDNSQQLLSPEHVTITRGVRRPQYSDDEEDMAEADRISRAQEQRKFPKRNRPKVDYKKFF
ncbi:unnamed protein product, partial [Iphiclides podalirius]